MIRTETTLIIGAGANREIELLDGPELLAKIAGGFEFERLDAEAKSRDLINFAALFPHVAGHFNLTNDELIAGAMAIRDATLVSTSIDSILEQYGHDPAVIAAGKLAIVYYTLQAESKSTMAPEPRGPGELPLRGMDNWLFHLGQLIVKGVPHAQAEQCFDKLLIVCFNYDRAIEHYLPWVVMRSFGMTYEEACALVAARLRIIHPYGVAGQLPWQGDQGQVATWGQTDHDNLAALSKGIYTASERAASAEFQSALRTDMARAKRIGFLGFGFDPMNVAMLFDGVENGNPDMLATALDINETQQKAIMLLIERLSGASGKGRIMLEDMKAFELLRDYGRYFES